MVDRRRDLSPIARKRELSVTSNSRDTQHLIPAFSTTHSLLNDKGLTAAAQIMSNVEQVRQVPNETWQQEVWSFYESLGEFNYGVEWFGETLSRVRLTAAKVTPGGDEPEIINTGPVSDLVSRFMGGVDGHAQLLRSLAVQLSVAGDAYFVGREVTDADITYGILMDAEPDVSGHIWTVHPVNTIRRNRRGISSFLKRGRQDHSWEMQVDEGVWVPISHESLVMRIWDRNERYPWRAMSPAKAALPIMREIDMYNRHIIASLVSRIAMNGMLFIPDEVVLPSSPQYENASDPFIAEMLDIMMTAIKNPGSAAAAAPMPIRIPSEYIDKFKHLTFATALDGTVFQSRADAIRRLATTLNLPAEVITGMGDVNHWSAWQLSEDAIKIHVAPKVELITRALTLGYLHPMLRAMGEDTRDADGSRYIIWYDVSELTQRPDRSGSAITLRDMMIISDAAARRETGFDEADAPTDDELEKMILMKLAINPQLAAQALKELTGLTLETPAPPESSQNMEPGQPVESNTDATDEPQNDNQPPDTADEPPPNPDENITASARRVQLIGRVNNLRRHARESIQGR